MQTSYNNSVAISDRKRRVLSGLNLVCLLLIVGLAMAYIRSHFVSDRFIGVSSDGGLRQLQLHGGGLHLLALDPSRSPSYGSEWIISEPADGAYIWPDSNIIGWSRGTFLGCNFISGNGYVVLRLPILLLIAIVMLYPIWWLRHPHRKPRTLFNHCAQCGYDIRGCIDRCSECGHPFKRAPIVTPPPPPHGRVRLVTPDRNPSHPTDDIGRLA